MRIGTLKGLCAAAAVVALALPAAAQPTPGQDEGTVRRQPGATVRPGQTERGVVVEEEGTIESEAIDGQGTRTANFPPGQGEAMGRLSDQVLVRWISAGNEAEIRVNEFAQQQAENEQVKQFAQKMVEEHTMMGEKLREAVQGGQPGQPGARGRSPRGEDRSRTRRTDELTPDESGATDDQPGAPGRRPGNVPRDDNSVSFLQPERQDREGRGPGARGRDMGGHPLLALHEEIKRQCAESTIQALREKQGADFDHAFMHQQVVEHMAMLDTLKVSQKHASENLKPVLQEAEQHTQQHLDQAKQILEQLENQRQQ